MSYKPFPTKHEQPYLVNRSRKPNYKRETVLTTDVLPIVGFSNLTKHFPDVFASHNDPWYLHYEFYDKDVEKIAKRIPSILNSFNRSRVLRRAKISGIRLCNIDCTSKIPRCINDMVVSSTYGAILIASLADTFGSISDSVTVTFKPVARRRDLKAHLEMRHNELLNRFWRRSHLPRHGVIIERVEDDDPLNNGYLSWRVTTSKSLFDIIYKLIEILYPEIEDVVFGSKGFFKLSKYVTADADDYMFRPMDKFLYNIRYRRYSAFGIYHNNPKYLLY